MAMDNSIIRIGDTPYVTGLFWQLLSDRERADAEAVSLGAKLGFDIYAIDSSGDAIQAGYGASSAMVKGGRSLALDIQEYVRSNGLRTDAGPLRAANWISVFELGEDRWYLLAVRAGAILPSSDYVGTPDEIIQRVAEIQAIGGWEASVGSVVLESLGIGRFAPLSLTDVLKGGKRFSAIDRWVLRRGVQFKPIKAMKSTAERRRQFILLAIGCCAIIGASVASLLGYEKYKKEEAQRAAEAAAEELRRKVKPVVPEWEVRPSAQRFLDACLSHYALTRPGGWGLEEFNCDGKEVMQAWGRRDGSVVQLAMSDPTTVIDKQFDRAVRRIAMPPLPESRENSIGRKYPDIVDLVSVMQALGAKFQIVGETDLAQPAAGNRTGVKKIQFSSNIEEMDPRAYMLLLPTGTRLNKLTWKPNNWALEGDIYVTEK